MMAGVLTNGQGEVLLACRPEHLHQGGRWEFPGGKLEPGEERAAGLCRELLEEIGVQVQTARPLIAVNHRYPERLVRLDVWQVQSWSGEPYGREGQVVEWVHPSQFGEREFPPADIPIFDAIDLPDRYLITGDFSGGDAQPFLRQLARRLEATAIELVQLRVKSCPPGQLSSLCKAVVDVAAKRGARVLLNDAIDLVEPSGAAGVHLTSAGLARCDERPLPETFLVGASCHGPEELGLAQSIAANFAVLAPVQPTMSHPGAPTLGWEAFQSLVGQANLPVFALGGVGEGDLSLAWQHGGQGIAAISAFWNE